MDIIKQHILERAGEDVTASSAGYDIKHYVLDIDGEDVNAFSVIYTVMIGKRIESPRMSYKSIGYDTSRIVGLHIYKIFIDDNRVDIDIKK